jgi:molybdopterin biosynthesis enzyme
MEGRVTARKLAFSLAGNCVAASMMVDKIVRPPVSALAAPRTTFSLSSLGAVMVGCTLSGDSIDGTCL